MSRIAMALVAGCLFAFPIASPMAQSDKPLAFEVGSIKPRQASDTSGLRFPTFEPGGRFVIRVTSSPPGASFQEILIEPVNVRDYRSRAQTVPSGSRLPRDLELAIGAELPAG